MTKLRCVSDGHHAELLIAYGRDQPPRALDALLDDIDRYLKIFDYVASIQLTRESVKQS